MKRTETIINNNIFDKEENKDDPGTNFINKFRQKESPKKTIIKQETIKVKTKMERNYDASDAFGKNQSEAKWGSNSETANPNDSPNQLRDQTPSQLTAKQTATPEEQEEQKEEDEKKPVKMKLPMSNTDLLSQDMNKFKILSKYEMKEVLNFPTIYYLNILERKLNGGVEEPTGTHNNGYDNEQGEYLFVNHDHINYRYEIVRKLGKGSFGVVLKWMDHL